MSPKIALIFAIFLACTLGFSTQIQASSNYVIFRANISPMYIQNSTAPIQVLAIPFENNKPVYANVEIHINIQGLNVNYSYENIIPITTGRSENIYLPAMQQGHYFIVVYAEYRGIKSQIIREDFGVVPAPLPYELYFSNDGSEIHFKSKVLNETGQIDPNTTFRLEIWLWDGSEQSLVNVYQNITNLTMEVPPNWRTGILIVDVIDQYGWRNGMSINLQKFQFQGYPVQYDYQQTHRYPAAGRTWQWYLGVIIIVLILLYAGKRVLGDGGYAEE